MPRILGLKPCKKCGMSDMLHSAVMDKGRRWFIHCTNCTNKATIRHSLEKARRTWDIENDDTFQVDDKGEGKEVRLI